MKGWLLFFRNEEDLEEDDYSERRLLEAARACGIEMEVLRSQQFDLVVNRADKGSILIDGTPRDLPDFVLSRMGSQTTYFASAIIRQLEYLGVPSVNTSSTIAQVGDKLQIYQLLAQTKLPIPRTMLAKAQANLEVVEKEIGLPCVVKTVCGTDGKGVHLCRTSDHFRDVMDLIYSTNSMANIIVQEYVKASHGKDIRIFVVGGRAIGAMHRTSTHGFKANVALGGSVAPFEITKELEWLSLEVCRLLQLDIAGIDFLFTDAGYTISEANSAPGFMGMELVTGRVIAEEIMDYIKVRFGFK